MACVPASSKWIFRARRTQAGWVASKAGVEIETLVRADKLLRGGEALKPALDALAARAATLAEHAVGFPFGLPPLIEEEIRKAFVASLAQRYPEAPA